MRKKIRVSEKNYLQEAFDHAKKSPASWLMQAGYLKRAADKICWIDKDHKPIDNLDVDFLYPIYRMLLGLSFENLLKGIIVVEFSNNKQNEDFEKTLNTHFVNDLLKKLEYKIDLSEKEKKLLRETESYVIWQGRYPFPKKKEMYKFPSHSTGGHRLEQELWGKLENHIEKLLIKSYRKVINKNGI